MARGFYWSNNINMPSAGGWPLVGEYGSIGFGGDTPIAQTGSGAGFVNVVGVGTLDATTAFTATAASGLVYAGRGGVFFVTAAVNLDNPEAEEALVQMRIAVDGVAVPRTTMSVIHTANAIDELAAFAQITLATGNVITAQVANASAGSTDLTSTYFRLQALRVG